jgi:hypothetical protein
LAEEGLLVMRSGAWDHRLSYRYERAVPSTSPDEPDGIERHFILFVRDDMPPRFGRSYQTPAGADMRCHTQLLINTATHVRLESLCVQSGEPQNTWSDLTDWRKQSEDRIVGRRVSRFTQHGRWTTTLTIDTVMRRIPDDQDPCPPGHAIPYCNTPPLY